MTLSLKIDQGQPPIDVASVEEASKAVRAYLERTGIGNSQWHGGDILQFGRRVAYVSYNGKVWRDNPRSGKWTPRTMPIYDPHAEAESMR